MKKIFVVSVLISIVVMGCDRAPKQPLDPVTVKDISKDIGQQVTKSAEQAKAVRPENAKNSELGINVFKPFYVYASKSFRENHFIPSGFMPNGKCIKFIDDWRENCHKDMTCIKVVYDVECSRQDEKWAGVYWLNPANNWGSRKGGFDLTGAEKLTFWARGEKGGEQVQEFTIGGITGDYPDTDTAVIGPVILGAQWKQYTIDLRGKDLSYISGGFAWTSSEDVNPEDCTFYLDDIKYE
jgi:hypothetical protein